MYDPIVVRSGSPAFAFVALSILAPGPEGSSR
jgi:hypothetical protein